MQYAVNLPVIGEYADPHVLMNLAQDAERAGWDAVFVWDSLVFDVRTRPAVTDPWIALAAIAATTVRIRIGTMIAQLARRRPWKVAREVVALDHLSAGRMILGVGLGFSGAAEFEQFGEDGDARVRADKLDECLTIVRGLCTGEPFAFTGDYYSMRETTFLPRPAQDQIPVWVAGYWPNKRPFRRAARWDGAAPTEVDINADGFAIIPSSPQSVGKIIDYIGRHRTSTGPYDVIISRPLPGESSQRTELISAYESVGVTWLLRDMLPWQIPLPEAIRIVRAGPLGQG
ncbi:LLM class flavin-dependent oxidoreductase [Actinoplanes sp. TFC3]|uniref:LLM class flavin-dependent oxidoreductase n=1 Tax=Actinoplanes sp. TFC3 TaxID=1710355 RepID=UPI000832961A|nr:LLM class flavin-dependent oxidoreductase [Actinoplanes sp. TFC3]